MAFLYTATNPADQRSPLRRQACYTSSAQIPAIRYAVVAPTAPGAAPVQLASPLRLVTSPKPPLGRSVEVPDKFGSWPSCRPQAAASVTSTAPSDNAESTPSQSEGEQSPWSLTQTFRLCDACDGERFLGRARLLDPSLTSVSTAVEMLNQGVVFCPEDLCLVLSASSQAYFVLYRQGCREKAVARFDLADAGSETGSGTLGSGGGGAASSSGGAAGTSVVLTPRPQGGPDAEPQADVVGRSSVGGRQESSVTLDIENRRFRLLKVIGQGAFGVVWKGIEQGGSGDGSVAAVKIMETSCPEDLSMAVFEADLLRLLKTQLPEAYRDQVPQYITHNVTQLSQAGGTVNLAMSFIPGAVLDQWLYGISDEEHKQVDIPQIVRERLPGSRMHSMPLAGACSFTANLLAQLAGVFAALQPIAFHRDISPHNVLIDIPTGADGAGAGAAKPSFALLDFGLAVRSDTWRRDWNESNLAGDPRYWMPSAWMAFAFGFDHVSSHQKHGFERQYLGRLDHYGLGVLGLEMLFALWNVENRLCERRAPGMLEAREAWCEFWEAMFGLFQMFHMQGPEVTREHLERTTRGDTLHIAQLLQKVQTTLREAETDPENAEYAAVLHVLADLIDEHGYLEWSEIPALFGIKSELPAPPEPAQARRPPLRLEGVDSAAPAPSAAGSCSPMGRRAVPTGSPDVTRYEVVRGVASMGGGVDRLSSTFQALPAPAQLAPRSPKQEHGMQLFAQSFGPHAAAGGAAAAQGPAAPSSPCSYRPPARQPPMERPQSFVPAPMATQAVAAAGAVAQAAPQLANRVSVPQPASLQRSSALGFQSRSYVPPAARGLVAGNQAATSRVSFGTAGGLCSTVRCVRRSS